MAVLAPRIIPIMQWDKPPSSKNHVDSSTPVCIQSDTGTAQIFYTLDGSKPQWASSGSGGRRYVSPFLLPAGRVCVRAVAVSSDGSESATVTKAFIVREAPPGGDSTPNSKGLPVREEAPRYTSATSSEDARFLRRAPFSCTVCGAPLPQRVTPPADGQKVCCVLCDSPVPVEALVRMGHAHTQIFPERTLSCPNCRRGNRADARYCDRCGAEVLVRREPATYETCAGCGAAVPPQAVNCIVCGLFPDAAPAFCHRVVTSSCQTQTSPAELRRTETRAAARSATDRRGRPPRSAISPGRGYWRQQVDHVCAHLRSFAQNDTPFRTLLGEPRLGRMTSAVLREDAHQVSLILSYTDVGRRTLRDGVTAPLFSDNVK
ncbi:double zinc ribbon and ankyrin repeat-containing protein 1 isoform X2 [Corythoichthys intestinalis]|uniref:double zinc ribbon and ankyrin repeat-containing protein 1 isoform X2 n=1 Tax=Corythoichthys intestinalis TaxID=161448 RepID=UPI0025A57C07|nr:double zinc ribbon and ankyrin repeat-containing protein 1 isoform X2 [Corythoichthys intestinalis]